MTEAERAQPIELAYARPGPAAKPPPSPAVAMLTCLPGLICWLFLLSAFVRPLIPRTITSSRLLPFGGVEMLVCWAAAIITALFSIGHYLRRRRARPWYVWINLIINITGLLFTAGILMLIAVVLAKY
jgi:hypothetical protein